MWRLGPSLGLTAAVEALTVGQQALYQLGGTLGDEGVKFVPQERKFVARVSAEDSAFAEIVDAVAAVGEGFVYMRGYDDGLAVAGGAEVVEDHRQQADAFQVEAVEGFVEQNYGLAGFDDGHEG